MNILIIGSGGREHTFAWKLKQSKYTVNLFVVPGNAGTKQIANNIEIDPNDFEAVENIVVEKNIEMLIVGPEEPLVRGIHDYFINSPKISHIPVIGPQSDAAQLEGSKDFAKDFMIRNNIPTAKYKSFTPDNIDEGDSFLETLSPPYVLKADGLAAGKGVLILDALSKAKNELKKILLDKKFGNAGRKVIIEEFLDGIELSFVLTDGKSYKILPEAKDYKRIGEGDIGLNTGGMGAVSPVPFVNEALREKIENRIVKPTIEGMNRENIPYTGFIFIGLMKVGTDPYVIEYNVRMGDPETQVVLPRIENDMVDILKAVANGSLDKIDLNVRPDFATTVVITSGGYPEDYKKGFEINGISDISSADSIVFHAGTKLSQNKEVLTNGGRVVAVTSLGQSVQKALSKSYNNITFINFEGMYYRRDIGFDLL
ncbi:phosphoribosylamine--glycine ligase [Elysia marginata]|uniref:phosphoribosylamine--glycine ligase n=1 Tax=Elysia marginata TaxID=1093978 RepID=A0AAV4G6E0_9GAST|nr:phosphoribosylamine--glycine ligase [Elysia marginata]